MLNLDPVASNPFFLHSVALDQTADDAEPLTAPGTNVEFAGCYVSLVNKAHMHPRLTSSGHGDL